MSIFFETNKEKKFGRGNSSASNDLPKISFEQFGISLAQKRKNIVTYSKDLAALSAEAMIRSAAEITPAPVIIPTEKPHLNFAPAPTGFEGINTAAQAQAKEVTPAPAIALQPATEPDSITKAQQSLAAAYADQTGPTIKPPTDDQFKLGY